MKFVNHTYLLLSTYIVLLIGSYLYPFSKDFSLNHYNVGVIRLDHFLHLIMFFPIPILLYPLVKKKNNRVFIVFLLGLSLAVLFESIHYFTPYRSFTVLDLCFNIIAVLLGTLLLIVLKRFKIM